MPWRFGAVHAPKEGCDESSYEDAYSIGLDDLAARSFRVAVSDGATECAFARMWAVMLVEKFVSETGWRRQLDVLARAWAADVWSRALPWNVQAKASDGAHASLLGVVVTELSDGRWRAQAHVFGDSCLFVLDTDGVIEIAVPYVRPEQFDQRPYLLSTDPIHRERALEHTVERRIILGANQLLLLCTDAIGRWLVEAPPDDVTELVGISQRSDRAGLNDWLERRRRARSVKDDDSTVVVIARAQ